ncbi:MAG TPA: septum formation initiator family protein [Symbiobacteriaceae bacterium]|nr:septum formation initiator family protein [Symbiobacteriaceae bacterium]
MSSARLRRQAFHQDDFTAPAPVRRPKRNLLRRHWLSGALIFVLAGLSVYSARSFFETEKQLTEVRARAAQLDQELSMKQRQVQALDDKLQQMTSDQYMEYLAKSMGYIYPGETVYQKGH